jgi:hypothetical protein
MTALFTDRPRSTIPGLDNKLEAVSGQCWCNERSLSPRRLRCHHCGGAAGRGGTHCTAPDAASSAMTNAPSPGVSSRDWKLARPVPPARAPAPAVDATTTWRARRPGVVGVFARRPPHQTCFLGLSHWTVVMPEPALRGACSAQHVHTNTVLN